MGKLNDLNTSKHYIATVSSGGLRYTTTKIHYDSSSGWMPYVGVDGSRVRELLSHIVEEL
jgi:hypothetical protein